MTNFIARTRDPKHDSSQAKADVVVSFDTAAPEGRRVQPAAHYYPALLPLKHLDRASIVLLGTILYLAQLGLKV
jgi:hypothetical protein